MKVLVVDDEPVARRRLMRILEGLDDVEVAGEAADGVEALEQIRALAPDAVLLDIRMPGLDGLSLAASHDELPPIIFTTAYDEYAVQAFEVSAVDYLLKPVRAERLEEALGRVRARDRDDALPLRKVLERLARQVEREDPLPVHARSGNRVRLFDPRAITRFHASAKYTVFHDPEQGSECVLDESLNALETRLAVAGFLRVHRSELVNLKHVTSLRSEESTSFVELSDGQSAPVSRRFLGELRRRLGIGGG